MDASDAPGVAEADDDHSGQTFGAAASSGRQCAGAHLRIYARDGDSRIKIIADDVPVPDAEREAGFAFFGSFAEAAAVSAACSSFLEQAKSPADAEGWHTFAAAHVPNLLQTARKAVWAGIEPRRSAAARAAPKRRPWTRERVARLAFLAGLGRTAKEIADDPVISSTPNNVQHQATNFGIRLSDAPQGQVVFRLPIPTLVVIDRAAATVHQTRNAFMRQWVIQGVRDGYGLVAVRS